LLSFLQILPLILTALLFGFDSASSGKEKTTFPRHKSFFILLFLGFIGQTWARESGRE
jgi:phosphoglycerol transferase MdoB-like AlkP superfamily enzyme